MIQKNKLLRFFGILSSTFLIVPLFFGSTLLKNNDSIEHNSNNLFFNNYQKNENLKQESKRNIDFPVYTIQKTGNDSEKNVLLIFGEGYSKNDHSKFVNDVTKKVNQLFTHEPYRLFHSDFNVYAIMPESKTSGDFSTLGKENNYFGGYFEGQGKRFPNFSKIDKFRELESQIKNGFLDEGASIFNSTILCNSQVYFGSGGYPATASLSEVYGEGFLMAHEIAHSFANLADEYLLDYGSLEENPNRTKESDPNKVRWKEFFNYKNIGIVKSGNSYIPSPRCKMGNSPEISEFCEVCKHEMFTVMNEKIKNRKDLYIGDPFISLEHNLESGYYYELGSAEPLINAKNKKIDFRTVIHNYLNKSKNIKLELKISDKNGVEKKKWTNNFSIGSNELKNTFILTEQINIDLSETDVIFGRVIDLDNNKELANTNKDKNDYYNLNINYKLFENNKETNNFINNASVSNIKVKKSTNIKLFIPNISQYQFVKKDVDIDEIVNIDKNYEITFYYKKTLGKNFTLNLLELDGKTIIQTKKQTIYENEIFTPNTKDFVVDPNQKIKRVKPPKEIITYENATTNKVINYTYEISAKPYIIANDVSIKLNSNFNALDYAKGFSYEWIEYPNLLKVESNNVDTSKPGHYTVTYSMTDNEGFLHNYVDIGGTTKKTINVIVLNSDGSIPENKPNPPVVDQNDNDLNAEISRINSMTFSLKKEKYTEEEINKITTDTILDYVNSWNPKTEFIYSVINFSKENNTFKFNIKVLKNDKISNSKEFSLSYSVMTNNEVQSEVNNEINRINSLDISLKKQEYNNNELNETNLLNELNFNKNNDFEYKVIDFSNKNSIVIFKIQVIKSSIAKGSKEFSLNYKLISDKNIENKNLRSLSKVEIILLSILIPLTIVAIGVVSWLFIFKKEK